MTDLLKLINQKIDELLILLTPLCTMISESTVNTKTSLYNLAKIKIWDEKDTRVIDFFSTCFDISKKLYLDYYWTGKNKRKKASDEILAEPEWLELWIALLLKSIALLVPEEMGIRLKRFNVFYKGMDVFTPRWLNEGSLLYNECELLWNETLACLKKKEAASLIDFKASTFSVNKRETLKKLPLTILFYEGPIARAYLETIRSLGYEPEKIIEIIPQNDLITKKIIGKYLPQRLRQTYAGSIHYSKIHYWSKYLKKSTPDLIRKIRNEIEKNWKIPCEIMNKAEVKRPLSYYSHCVESLLIDSLSDRVLYEYLSKEPKSSILFTGGGIVPESLLAMEHLKFLHIHPGYLPLIRGADCTLWSLLLTGHTSATCFYMASEIDAGDIILPCWLPKIVIPKEESILDLKMQYRAIYAFLDPWVRSFVLIKMIEVFSNDGERNFSELQVYPQNEEGVMYHFMHSKLQHWVLN